MVDQRIIVRTLALERAIRTVIHDLRIPEKLRTALSVYQDQRDDLDSAETDWLRRGPAEDACPLKTIRPSLVEVCQTCNMRSKPHEHGISDNSEITAIEREIKICLWYNDESLDWSIEIDGQRHEHVTSEIMEALVECALIVAQMSLTRALASAPQ
jgi:hypothetical protein